MIAAKDVFCQNFCHKNMRQKRVLIPFLDHGLKPVAMIMASLQEFFQPSHQQACAIKF